MNADDADLELTTQDEVSDSTSSAPMFSAGSQLKAARETKELTVAEVSRSLKLSVRQVQAIELDDWKSLPSKAIVRGFIRNYARLLGVDYSALVPALDGLQKEDVLEFNVPSGPQVDLPRQGRFASRDTLWTVAGLVILLFGLSVYFVLPDAWWEATQDAINHMVNADKSSESEQGASEGEKTVSAEQGNIPNALPQETGEKTRQEAAQETGGPLENSQTMEQTTQVQPVPQAVAVSPAASIASSGLKFSFQKDSWVEVRDRTGETIFSQLNRAGESREIVGEPPLSLVIGNASHVTLSYKGSQVDLSNRSRDDVTRITLK